MKELDGDRYIFYSELDKRFSQLQLERYDWESKARYGCKYNRAGKRCPLYVLTSIYCGFDIETSTVYTKDLISGKEGYYSSMYVAMFSINDTVILFRTWLQVRQFFQKLPKVVGLSPNTTLLTWVHNLDYENSYIKHRFDIDKTTFFGKSKQKPIKYLLENHFFFHDSACITQSTLKKLAEMYKTRHKKKTGDIDYEIPRNSKTELTETEIGYCINDVLILSDFSEIMINQFLLEKGYIPDTATQILSKELQENAVTYAAEFIGEKQAQKVEEKWLKNQNVSRETLLKQRIHGKIFGFEFTSGGYLQKVSGLVDFHHFTPFDQNNEAIGIYGAEIYGERYYDFYEWLYRGGYTKSNARYTSTDTKLIDGLREPIGGYDYNSSYPFVQTVCNFPMSSFKEVTMTKAEIMRLKLEYDHDDFEKFRYIFLLEFEELQSIDDFSLESESKVMLSGKSIIDNGRINYADHCTACLTDCDFALYKMYYKWKELTVVKVWKASAGRLPRYFLETVWSNGVKKTALKGVEGMEVEYQISKQKFNSSYGLCVKQPVYVEYKLGNTVTPTGYETEEDVSFKMFGKCDSFGHIMDGIETYTQNRHTIETTDFQEQMKRSILSPFWGIWTSAFARYNLLSTMKKISENSEWITSDVIYCDTDSIYFKNPDKHITIILTWNAFAKERIKKYLPPEHAILSSLGQFTSIADEDSHGYTQTFKRFKTLGAKRYIKTVDTAEGEKTKVTVAGLPKGSLEKWCAEKRLDIYREFHNLMNFEIDGIQENVKLARVYHDYHTRIMIDGEVMDEFSSCTLYPSTFKLKMKDVYITYVNSMLEEICRKQIAKGMFENG